METVLCGSDIVTTVKDYVINISFGTKKYVKISCILFRHNRDRYNTV